MWNYLIKLAKYICDAHSIHTYVSEWAIDFPLELGVTHADEEYNPLDRKANSPSIHDTSIYEETGIIGQKTSNASRN